MLHTRKTLLSSISRPTTYTGRVLALARASLVAYWPLAELSGSVAMDESGAGRNGAYTSVTLNQPGIGDGRSAAAFDGLLSYVNVYSASLASAFNGAEGTLLVWGLNTGIGATALRVVNIEVDTSNLIRIRYTPSSTATVWQYTAGGTAKSVTLVSALSSLRALALTWSKSTGASGELRAYIDGAQTGTTQTSLGTWAGTPAATTTVIGAGNTTPTMGWVGSAAHAALWSTALTAAQIATLATV